MARSRTRTLLPWLILGPLLLTGGALLGRAFPEWVGRTPPPGWSESERVSSPAPAPAQRLPSLAPVVDAVRDGVVAVTTVRRGAQVAAGDSADPPGPGPRLEAPAEELRGFGIIRGTGFVVHKTGLIVTSHHVVAGYSSIRVDFTKGRWRRARVVGEDPISDLALLQVDLPPEDLKVLEFAPERRVRQGDWVLSIGNPFEFQQSLSLGLITYVGRHIPEERVQVTNEYLQFSSPVNPGESGAPLLNLNGAVIGVIRRTLTEGRGISFGVPSKIVKALLRAVQQGDTQLRRGYAGMEFRQPRDPMRPGAQVTRVIKGHPADTAGVQVGDVILQFDGQPIHSPAELYDQITDSKPGSAKPLSVEREGEVIERVTVILGEVGKTSVD